MAKKIKLKNGLRLIMVPEKRSQTSTVLVLVEAGSEYETKKINGLSHFLEHICFKGTKKRPKPGTISEELDSLGAEYNAFTNQEYTGYWAKVEKHKFGKILELISDLYLNPIFNQEEIEKERGVVIEELNMYEDMPMSKVGDLFNNLMYGNQPTGWDVGGEKEVIKTLNREDFIKYRKLHYTASKTVVIISGSFDWKKALASVKEYFGKLPKEKKISKIETKQPAKGPKILVRHKESEQSHFVLGVPAFDIFDKKRFALTVLSGILGGGMSSRLFKKVREELGAAYYIRSSSDSQLDHGELAVSSGTAHGKTEEVIQAVLHEFERLKNEPVPEEELKKVKDYIASGLVMGLETSDQQASFYGFQEVLAGKMRSPKELIAKINSVKKGEIMAVAREIFKTEKLNLAIIGPYKKNSRLKKLLKLSK